MKILLTLITYVASLVVTALLTFAALMGLANSSAVPALVARALDGGLLLLFAWAIVLIVPAWVAWRVWRRLHGIASQRHMNT